jgi:deoxyhypusine synthase
MYGMDNYHGEPMIQELLLRIGEVNVEIEEFREIFEHTLDEELEEELNAEEAEEEEYKESLFHQSS